MTKPKTRWHFLEATIFTTRQAKKLNEAIRAACQIDPEDDATLDNFTAFLPLTEGVDFPADKALPSLKAMPAFLAQWQDMSPADVWEFRVRKISHHVWIDWVENFTKRETLFEADPAELPESELTPEQKAEAALPGSPLTSPEPNSPGA